MLASFLFNNHQWNLDLECQLSQLFLRFHFLVHRLFSLLLLLSFELLLFLQFQLGLDRRIIEYPYLDLALYWMLKWSVSSCCLLGRTSSGELRRLFRSFVLLVQAVSCVECVWLIAYTRHFGSLFGTRVFLVWLFGHLGESGLRRSFFLLVLLLHHRLFLIIVLLV